ncbi:MAG: non-heme iron oxygenase ferredoxin subunit [Acidobacteria bacterium]|nr:non-heme iron oxygenase ferredoxin subunit [Acidobacteriota bacterium]MYF14692.1 non-heme iron oxygenase ferredoxin subunit [Acidobacteriota bacterium]MYI96161.1 non-heme iron oxygenase ferredoxin subunit [Acidobacteriota bacterium]
MADWIRACATDDIEEQDLVRWDHGGRTYAIYRTGDGFYCTDGLCTHAEQHLEEGLLTGHVIECPLHQGRFDIRSGEVLSPPPCVGLGTYPVRTENDQVFVNV